jgi:hypothetical protein
MMSKNLSLAVSLVLALALLTLAPRASRAEHVRVTNPNSVNVELLGRGMLYSVSYDRVVTDDLVAGVGFGTTSTRTLSDVDAGVSTALLPLYVNYYFMREGGSPFATLGADIVTNSGEVNGLKSTYSGIEFGSRAVLATVGAGYESRTDAGILFRVAVYGIYAKTISPWGGLTLGYCF